MLPQLGLGILKVITVQSTLVISGLQEGGPGAGLVVGTEVGDEWRSHVYEVGPVAQGGQGASSVHPGWFAIPELNLIRPVGNSAIIGSGGIIEEVVKLGTSSVGETGVVDVRPGPVGQYNSGTNA